MAKKNYDFRALRRAIIRARTEALKPPAKETLEEWTAPRKPRNGS